MSTSPKLRPGIWDALVALTVAVLAVACAWTVWGGQDESGALTAVVSVDGVETERLALEEAERTIQAGGYTLRLRLTETEVWVESSDCPTQDLFPGAGRASYACRPGSSSAWRAARPWIPAWTP